MADAVVDQGTIELAAYAQSGYTYDDAAKLAWYWGQGMYEAKMRIGRKVKWQNRDIIDQMLYEATGQYNWIMKSPYTMADAEALARYWDCSVEQAKVVGGHKLEGWLILNQALASAPAEVEIITYVVAKGDTLSKIAAIFSTAGDDSPQITWQEIYELNSDIISDPNLIHPGQILRIPRPHVPGEGGD